jgi:hypothetical protein
MISRRTEALHVASKTKSVLLKKCLMDAEGKPNIRRIPVTEEKRKMKICIAVME